MNFWNLYSSTAVYAHILEGILARFFEIILLQSRLATHLGREFYTNFESMFLQGRLKHNLGGISTQFFF